MKGPFACVAINSYDVQVSITHLGVHAKYIYSDTDLRTSAM